MLAAMMRAPISLLVALLAGCGGGDDGGPTTDDGQPLSPSALSAACQETCAHGVMCAWYTDQTACEANCASQSGFFRGTGYAAWMGCLAQADCAGPNVGEGCYVQAATAAAPRDVHDEYVTSCQGLTDVCPVITLPSNVCDLDNVILFSDPYMTSTVLPCFDLGCDQVSGCLETNVLDAF
jgi:hypothetical protein